MSSFRTRDELMEFPTKISSNVWLKHAGHMPESARLTRVLSHLEGRVSRKQIFELSDRDLADGVIAATIWGFPRGSYPGGKWRPLAQVFENCHAYASVLKRLKQQNKSAAIGITLLNNVTPGVGFATTTKFAYFSKLTFLEGAAIIFDRQVMTSLQQGIHENEFSNTKTLIGPRADFYGNGVLAYGDYLREASAYARSQNRHSDEIEAELFFRRPKDR